MSQYAFHFDGTRCTGCKTCEFACKDFRDLQVGFAYRKVYEVTYGETTKDSNGCFATSCTSYPLSLACNHCDDPACTHVCPTGAMHKDAETGLVSVDAEKCVGCGYCHMACPYNAPKVDREKGHSVKCDGCAERVAEGKAPACVEACSMRALSFGPMDSLPSGGVPAAVAPLPDPSVTTPNFLIKACASSQPCGSTSCVVANAAEVK